jgi:hypothetical protein
MHDYPTNEELKKIREWDCSTYDKSVALADYVCKLWYWGHPFSTLTGKKVKTLRLATGGWSGNESIISALDRNFLFNRFWIMSKRGGLHIYKIKN